MLGPSGGSVPANTNQLWISSSSWTILSLIFVQELSIRYSLILLSVIYLIYTCLAITTLLYNTCSVLVQCVSRRGWRSNGEKGEEHSECENAHVCTKTARAKWLCMSVWLDSSFTWMAGSAGAIHTPWLSVFPALPLLFPRK